MLHKPDLEDIVPRMQAWWQGELLDRACLAVTAPNGRPMRQVPDPATHFARRTDIHYLLDSAQAYMQATYFAGEAIPFLRPDLGPDAFSACLGAPLEYTEHTTWAAPIIANWDCPPSFQIDPESFAWKWHHEFYRAAAQHAAGKYFLAAPDCHSGGDSLLALRGGEALCLDLYDNPQPIRAAMAELEKTVLHFHSAWWPLIEASGQRGHASSWIGAWSPGRSNVIQLDLLALISPAQFRDFFCHELEIQIQALDNTIYHLDGPQCLPHLPALHQLLGHTPDRSRDKLRRSVIPIQWVHGEGNRPMTRWIPLLRQIQAHGANLHLACAPQEVETLLRELSSRGLFLCTTAATPQEADELIKLAARLGHD